VFNYEGGEAHILRDAGFSTTSLGISDSGVLAALGGVLVKEGRMLGGTLPASPLRGKGEALVVAGTAGSIPAARNFSSKELGSGTGVEADEAGAR
jgi:hypothetical protein